jgi:hypothetical protein
MKWTRLLLLVLLSAIVFGGTFTCKYKDDDDKHVSPR